MREVRRRAGLSQAELAARLGTTQSAIARLETGRGRPTLERLSQVAAACGLDLQVRLVPADDHDLAMARRNRSLPVDERARNAVAAARFVLAGREAVAARGGPARPGGGR